MITKDLFDKEVLDINADKVGKLLDIDFDLKSGIVNHIIVQAGLFKLYDINVSQIDKIGDKLILGIAKKDLKKKA